MTQPTEQSDTETAHRPRPLFLIDHSIEIQCNTPIDIIPHHQLRKATADEIAVLRQGLEAKGLYPGWSSLRYEAVSKVAAQGGTIQHRSHNPADWKYWVIEVGEGARGSSNDGINDIELVARITDTPLRCPLAINVLWGGFCHLGQAAGLFGGLFAGNPVIFDEHALQQFQDLFKLFKALDPKFKHIGRAVVKYFQLTAIVRDSPLYLLGVFAVIEGLLTHNPTGAYDALTHQIWTKMTLLNARFDQPLDISVFKVVDAKKMWSKLYEARSCIAHGSDPDFTKSLAVLKTAETVVDFVDRAARALLRHSLKEPQLVSDLNVC